MVVSTRQYDDLEEEQEDDLVVGREVEPTDWCRLFDDVLPDREQKAVYEFVARDGWKWGWKSSVHRDLFSFWHKHYAGALRTDHSDADSQYNCEAELQTNAPLLHSFWVYLRQNVLKDHILVRCYANAYPYGTDGTTHTDSVDPSSFTSIYYLNLDWKPDWGGETVFFNRTQTDGIAAVYPKPNRLFVFSGTVPHAARGVSRICPALRTTLMFKSVLCKPLKLNGR